MHPSWFFIASGPALACRNCNEQVDLVCGLTEPSQPSRLRSVLANNDLNYEATRCQSGLVLIAHTVPRVCSKQ